MSLQLSYGLPYGNRFLQVDQVVIAVDQRQRLCWISEVTEIKVLNGRGNLLYV